MEEPPSLLCPDCGKLYDLKETFPDCDHLYCASCFLVTNDRTCRVCKLHDVNLCECSKYGAIKRGLMELESELEDAEADIIENQIKGIQEKCSDCSKSSETNMICVNCANIMLKRLENEEWIIQEIEGDVRVADDVICADCAASGHGEHELVEVAGIQNLTDAIKNEFFLEYYHHQKSILQLFSPNIEKHKGRAIYFYEEVNERSNEEYYSTCSTQIIECYREERQKLTNLMLKVLKLIMRLQKMYIDCLEKHIDHQVALHKEAATDEKKKSINRLLIRLNMTQMKFENFMKTHSQVQLTPGDIQEVDAELYARMETLEVKYKKGLMIEIELENGSKFHKYQAIMKETEKINSRFTSLRSENEESTEEDFIEKCLKNINSIRANYHDQERNPEEAIKFYEMEIMQAKIRQDKEAMKLVETNVRLFFRELMKLKFFPISPEADAMDAMYNRFFQFW